MNAPTPRDVLASDAEKLLTLATWFDAFDDWREATGKIAPGITEYREVQADLRRIAAALTRREPLDVERLNAACLVVFPWWADDVTPYRWADRIAAEYSRLEAADKT